MAVTQDMGQPVAQRGEAIGLAFHWNTFTSHHSHEQPLGKPHIEVAELLWGCLHQASTQGKQVVRAEREWPPESCRQKKVPLPWPSAPAQPVGQRPKHSKAAAVSEWGGSWWAQNTQLLTPTQCWQVETATKYYHYAEAQIHVIFQYEKIY